MFLLAKPDDEFINKFLAARQEDNFSYPEVGASRSKPPANYNIDHNRIQLGSGLKDFEKATEAVRQWKMFDMPWIKIYPPDAPIRIGENVAILINHFGFWSLNASRIIYIIEQPGEVEKYGFAYGTLREHGECGEERFSVEFHHSTQEVWYDLFAFSKPNHPLAKISYPISRYLQKAFAAGSKTAMQRFVSSDKIRQT